MAEAHARFRDDRDGTVSHVYPALARVDPDLFGIAVVSVAGPEVRAGDADAPFTIMSVSKPFVFALACQLHGADVMWERVGANATGLPFDSAAAVDHGAADARTRWSIRARSPPPSFAPGADETERTRWVVEGLSRFAGPRARGRRRGVRLGVSHERPQPGPRAPAGAARAPRLRPGRGRRHLHAPVLPRRLRRRPGGDGRDAGERAASTRARASGWSTPTAATPRWR